MTIILLRSARFWLTGPLAFVLAILVMLGMAIWFPKGAADIDNLIMPMLAFPLIWALAFFYAYLDRNIKRVALSFAALGLVHIALLAAHFSN